VRIVEPDGLRSIMSGQVTHCEPRSAG